MDYTLYQVADNAEGQLDSSIGASDTTIVLKSGEGALFPTTYNGSATSGGDANTLNSTGIGATGVVVGDFIENITDGSHAYILTVSTNSITTTTLQGGSGNTWDNSDVWAVGMFIATLNKRNSTTGVITQSEKVKIQSRATDTLTVFTGGRGFDGSTAATYDADDYINVFVTSKVTKDQNVAVAEQATNIKSLQDTAPSSLEKTALARLLDFDLTYTSISLDVTVEGGVYNNAGDASSDTPLTLDASSTCYIEVNQSTGVISFNTTAFNPTTSIALWQVTTDGSGVTSATDKRQSFGDFPGGSTTPVYLGSQVKAGVDIAANEACYVSDAIETLGDAAKTTDLNIRGGSAANTREKQGQSFQLASAASGIGVISIELRNNNSPTDSLDVRIETDSSGVPSGTLVDANATGNIDYTEMTGTSAKYDISFDGEFSLSASTTYWVVLQRTGAYDASNCFNVSANTSGSTISTGEKKTLENGTWVTNSGISGGDWCYLKFGFADARLKLAATTDSDTKKFLGFASEAITAGNNGELVTNGVLDGFTGLTPNEVYILSGTGGAITAGGTTPYTGEIVTGVALSSTRLLIKPLDFFRSV